MQKWNQSMAIFNQNIFSKSQMTSFDRQSQPYLLHNVWKIESCKHYSDYGYRINVEHINIARRLLFYLFICLMFVCLLFSIWESCYVALLSWSLS